LPPASSTAVAAVARAVDRVALNKEFVLLPGLIDIAQRRTHYAFITDEKRTAIKVRSGRTERNGASGLVQGEGGDARLRACSARMFVDRHDHMMRSEERCGG